MKRICYIFIIVGLSLSLGTVYAKKLFLDDFDGNKPGK